MTKFYNVAWAGQGLQSISGMLTFEYDNTDEVLSLEEWGEKKLQAYLKDIENKAIKPNDSTLSYYIFTNHLLGQNVRILSVHRVIKDIKEIGKIESKTKEKIEKLLNLSMSENENEAKLASQMAYKLMKKHSLTKGEVEGQEFISLELSPKGKKVSGWEQQLYGAVCRASGVFFSFHRGIKGDDLLPNINAHLKLTGRERDVLNTSYLIECYAREIENLMTQKKRKEKLSTKEANDYRFGLIVGIGIKLARDKEQFFNEQQEKFYDVVSIDTRLEEAKELFKTEKARRITRTVGQTYVDGAKDAKKIIIRKATENKGQKTKKIGGVE